MDKATAVHIITSLANGKKPFTDDKLPRDSTIQNVEVVRALFFALSVIKSYTHEQKSLETLIDISRSEQEYLWIEYCQLTNFENPYPLEDEAQDVDNKNQEYDLGRHEVAEDNYDPDYEDPMKEILQELHDERDNYARSEEEGWFYEE